MYVIYPRLNATEFCIIKKFGIKLTLRLRLPDIVRYQKIDV